ncbi:putative copper amine oxidase [Hortaea werneckii]|nr:putative copper amine oxidase [Hortaea werneckii]KAI6990622.1 putative copper amine oxidase [Hortaea werneckii]KAI7141767.1 putative copper amine oxidase [Hortaea werneckii]KAI7171500.1 putative copper amine oxidase [Hortaea werneckii]
MELESFTMRATPWLMSTFAVSLAYMSGSNAAPSNDNVSSMKLQDIMNNFSSSFGWALAGSATSIKQLENMCDNITETGHGMWATQGLIPERIVDPLCNKSHSGPNATLALPWIVYYNTRVFSTRITNSFASQNKSADMEYLCDNLRYRLLDGFGIEGATAINATCNAATQARNPRPEAALAMIDKNATGAYQDALSRLFGFLFASSACTSSELDDYCAQASHQVKSWDKMMLNGTLVEETICDVKTPMSSENAKAHLRESMSKAFSTIVRRTNKFHEAIVNLTQQKVESNVRLGPNVHAPGDGEEIMAIERIALEDEGVQAEIAKLKLPEGSSIVVDPWIYGSDGINDDDRMWQTFMYMRDPQNSNEADSNHYALPLSISPVISSESMKVIRIDHLPTGKDNTIKEPQPWTPKPANEYIPEAQSLRTDLKPLNVVQPEGASFSVTQQGTSSIVEWQKWSFRVGFNQREGMVLYDVRYDGRSLFYRLSLSDMNIPYADPRHPFHKKSAFDLGDAGAGVMANNLKLGCDCLGSIHYLSAVLSDDKGEPMDMPNVVCIHEQDGGIGWKHTNYRTGRAAVVRNRELVLQSIITVANYEYILAFQFNQAGEVDYEVRATGILSTQPIDEGLDVPWGTVVHPGVLATHHQHIFSLRVDPMIDGHQNRLVYDEALPMPRSEFNPHGTGYFSKETVCETSGGYDIDISKNQVYKIQNAAVRNSVNNKPVAYKIHAPPFQKIISDTESFNYKRAEFSDRNIYAVKYRDGELFAGGKYTNQSRGGTGVRSWADRKENIVDDDLVVFVQFGINHIPRIEDFPVMPCEIIKVSMKPVNFFDKNPALDVPPSTQDFNKSTLISEAHQQGVTEAKINADGTACCAAPSSKL